MGQMLGTSENYIFFSLANIINIKVCLTGRFVNHFESLEIYKNWAAAADETVYHTPVAIAGLLEDVPNRLVPIGDLVITPGGFEEEVRDGDEDSNQELESVALQVVERVLEEDENDTLSSSWVVGV